jgi:excisionase family DNA binding protein
MILEVLKEVSHTMTVTDHKPPQRATVTNLQFEPLLDSAEAAALLQIHPKTLQKLARAGTVIGIRVGRLWRFRASALNDWLVRMAG